MVSFDVRLAGGIVFLVGLVQIITTWPVAHGVDNAWVYWALGVPYFFLGILGMACMGTRYSRLLSFFFWSSVGFLTLCAIPLWISYWARLHHYINNNLCATHGNCGHYRHYLGTLGALWGFLDIFVMPAVAYLTYKWWISYTGGMAVYQDNAVPIANNAPNVVPGPVYANGNVSAAPSSSFPMYKSTTTHTTTLPSTGIPVV